MANKTSPGKIRARSSKEPIKAGILLAGAGIDRGSDASEVIFLAYHLEKSRILKVMFVAPVMRAQAQGQQVSETPQEELISECAIITSEEIAQQSETTAESSISRSSLVRCLETT